MRSSLKRLTSENSFVLLPSNVEGVVEKQDDNGPPSLHCSFYPDTVVLITIYSGEQATLHDAQFWHCCLNIPVFVSDILLKMVDKAEQNGTHRLATLLA